MSKIEITSNNIDKFVKRFHKVTDAKNNGKKLSESQEIFAQSLGCSNYNELKKSLNKEDTKIKSESIIVNDLLRGFQIENIEKMSTSEFIIEVRNITKNSELNNVQKFYQKLLTLIHHPKSKISLCSLSKDKFEYTIEFITCYGDKFSYIFGQRSHDIPLSTILNNIGFSEIDVTLVTSLFEDNSIDNLNLKNRFESIDFANRLFQYLCEIRGIKYMFLLKFNKDDTVNHNYTYKHDLLYKKATNYIKIPEIKEMNDGLLDHKDNDYVYIKSRYILNTWSNGSEPLNYLESLSNNDIIIEKADIDKLKSKI